MNCHNIDVYRPYTQALHSTIQKRQRSEDPNYKEQAQRRLDTITCIQKWVWLPIHNLKTMNSVKDAFQPMMYTHFHVLKQWWVFNMAHTCTEQQIVKVHQVFQEFQSMNIINFAVTMHTAFTYSIHNNIMLYTHHQFIQSLTRIKTWGCWLAA